MKDQLEQLVLQMHGSGLRYSEAVREFQRSSLTTALREQNGNQVRAAQRLGIHRNTLRLPTPLLGQLLPNTMIILFTQQEGGEVERIARAAGINAVVSKSQAASELVLKAQALLSLIEQEPDLAKFRNVS